MQLWPGSAVTVRILTLVTGGALVQRGGGGAAGGLRPPSEQACQNHLVDFVDGDPPLARRWRGPVTRKQCRRKSGARKRPRRCSAPGGATGRTVRSSRRWRRCGMLHAPAAPAPARETLGRLLEMSAVSRLPTPVAITVTSLGALHLLQRLLARWHLRWPLRRLQVETTLVGTASTMWYATVYPASAGPVSYHAESAHCD